MAKRRSQSDHDNMVESGANILKKKGYRNVKADITKWDKPTKITWKRTGKGHVPDITGEGTTNIIVEVETSDSIDDTHTEDQWELFSKYAEENNMDFFVRVPKTNEKDAEDRLSELGLNGKVWTA